jgi:hypothetical protein
MLKRIFMVACFFAGLAACEGPEQSASVVSEPKAMSVMPEHFDRVRAEQVEKEEEKLRRRGRN